MRLALVGPLTFVAIMLLFAPDETGKALGKWYQKVSQGFETGLSVKGD